MPCEFLFYLTKNVHCRISKHFRHLWTNQYNGKNQCCHKLLSDSYLIILSAASSSDTNDLLPFFYNNLYYVLILWLYFLPIYLYIPEFKGSAQVLRETMLCKNMDKKCSNKGKKPVSLENKVKVSKYLLFNKHQRVRLCAVSFYFIWQKMYTVKLQSISVTYGQINMMVKINVVIIFFHTAFEFTFVFSSASLSFDTNNLLPFSP